jgi:RNA polymerase sigma-70 factor (ECF subfamily)
MPRAHLRIVAPSESDPSSEGEELAELVRGVRLGRAKDERELVERFTPMVERLLLRILGVTSDLDDLCQETLIRVFDRIDKVRDASALRGFVASVSVFVAREAIRKKRRRKWLFFLPPEEVPEVELPGFEPEAREALLSFYEVVAFLPDDERIAFCLRYVEQMELIEITFATDASMSTVKRRLKGAEARFKVLAARRPELERLMKEGTRWPTQTP